jgi:hypothetical protein
MLKENDRRLSMARRPRGPFLPPPPRDGGDGRGGISPAEAIQSAVAKSPIEAFGNDGL